MVSYLCVTPESHRSAWLCRESALQQSELHPWCFYSEKSCSGPPPCTGCYMCLKYKGNTDPLLAVPWTLGFCVSTNIGGILWDVVQLWKSLSLEPPPPRALLQKLYLPLLTKRPILKSCSQSSSCCCMLAILLLAYMYSLACTWGIWI